MKGSELAEIQRRAEIISRRVADSLESELSVLFQRKVARGELRSGSTVKESAAIARTFIQNYFSELEHFVRLSSIGLAGADVAIIEAIASSTTNLIDSVFSGIQRAATHAGDPKLVEVIKPEILSELSDSQEIFRSNIRAYGVSNKSKRERSSHENILLGIELVCLVAISIVTIMWIRNPEGSYEPYSVLFGLGLVATDMYRRVNKSE